MDTPYLEEAVFAWAQRLAGDGAIQKSQRDHFKKRVVRLEEGIADINRVLDNQLSQKERLQDLAIANCFPDVMIEERKKRLELTIHALENEITDLYSKKQKVLAFRSRQDKLTDPYGPNKEAAIVDFQSRRLLIEYLDVKGSLGLVNGTKIAQFTCRLGEKAFRLRGWGRQPVITPIDLSIEVI